MRIAPDILFKTLADPTRRAIFERLCGAGEQTVGMMTDDARVSQPGGAQALECPQARRSGERKARGMPDPRQRPQQGLKPLIDWMSLYGAFWRDRFDRLEQNRMDQ